MPCILVVELCWGLEARKTEGCAKQVLSSTGSEPKTAWYREVSVPCILVVELCERLVFYSMSGNMVLFCTSVLGYGNAAAVTVNTVFIGT